MATPAAGAGASSSPPAADSAATITSASVDKPAPSTGDSSSRKPRDARLIHLVLSSMNVTAYQERVPLMLMDFAYRYTSGVLQDALLFSDAINGTANTGGQNPPATIGPDDLRMSIASRVNHQFNTSLPKEFLLDISQERNRVALPTVGPEFGVRLPPEKYCLTGVNWDLKEAGGEEMDTDDEEETQMGMGPITGLGGREQEDEDQMEVEDLFGEDTSMGDA
ncbi:Similar to Transcription initiation factor TFIID subunit 9; acc. no. Q05027 [Pyronema omphalodes CBS 100304]|uniref:Similar to Transcription initiation factor TFIID subunit 9 acc. no. Q05027 n=1 Tax=Pyronema omphalodes (strain CBS 100304) TaxID=1076935 RepID=U4LHH4_PYROM|nr:Similar to Transcription initiation factor TFIID subunit 9; acc. no. Q05027 [Pyronema omphalodes CBS 100304]